MKSSAGKITIRPLGRRLWVGSGVLSSLSVGLAVLAVSAFSLSFSASAEESTALPPLPEKIQDVLEADRLRRRKELAALSNEVREAEGVQLSELENTYQQLSKVRDLLELNTQVRILLRTSPELMPHYQRVVGINPGPASCECLDNAELNWVGQQAQEGQAFVTIAGQLHEAMVGSEVGNSGCRLAEVSVAGGSATLRCGSRSRTFAYQALPASGSGDSSTAPM